eukprot:jgi/Mesen1/10409/ME000081S09801
MSSTPPAAPPAKKDAPNGNSEGKKDGVNGEQLAKVFGVVLAAGIGISWLQSRSGQKKTNEVYNRSRDTGREVEGRFRGARNEAKDFGEDLKARGEEAKNGLFNRGKGLAKNIDHKAHQAGDSVKKALRTHTVQRGDTLYGLARRYRLLRSGGSAGSGSGSGSGAFSSFKRRADAAEEVSQSVPDDNAVAAAAGGAEVEGGGGSARLALRRGIDVPLYGRVLWKDLWRDARWWVRQPLNAALLVWVVLVGVSGAILFLVMTGMLNAELPRKSQRNTWFEIQCQILTALFTFMALLLHPGRIRASIALARWRPADVVRMRRLYCKGGRRKPHEWKHMLVVNVCLQLNCIFQYGMAAVTWAYSRADRPAFLVAIFVTGAIGFPAFAGLYNSLSPLNRDYDTDDDDGAGGDGEAWKEYSLEEQQRVAKKQSMHARALAFFHRRGAGGGGVGGSAAGSVVRSGAGGTAGTVAAEAEEEVVEEVRDPRWQGGLLTGCCCCCGNIGGGGGGDEERGGMESEGESAGTVARVCVLSTLCCFCVHGGTMDRLGFGNRFVHTATFALFVFAPFLIFDLAAINVNDTTTRGVLGAVGIAASALGLLYGGYWRIQMREAYRLPASSCCCGHGKATDCATWLFCPLCALCQEVRTAEHYEIRPIPRAHAAHSAGVRGGELGGGLEGGAGEDAKEGGHVAIEMPQVGDGVLLGSKEGGRRPGVPGEPASCQHGVEAGPREEPGQEPLRAPLPVEAPNRFH